VWHPSTRPTFAATPCARNVRSTRRSATLPARSGSAGIVRSSRDGTVVLWLTAFRRVGWRN
jgi:hypothetical protein